MKRFVTAIALSCVLSASALAGDVPSVGAPAPASNGVTETTEPGDVQTPGKAELSSEALSVLLSVLSFLT
jgi:hypothetical protein